MTSASSWQLQNPVSAIVFDCDGTLTAMEGIDELAKHRGVEKEVKLLTEEAMGKSGINPNLYEKRLRLVKPTQEEVLALGADYYSKQVPDIKEIIQLYLRLHKAVYIISAGLYPAVSIFGQLLHVPSENIFAVGIQFDKQGQFLSYDKTSPLIHNHGKREIITHLKDKHKKIIYVGDGLNDYATYDLVTRFIGYGGIFYRENIAALCKHYIRSASMTPLLPLSLTQKEYESLTQKEQTLYQTGIALE